MDPITKQYQGYTLRESNPIIKRRVGLNTGLNTELLKYGELLFKLSFLHLMPIACTQLKLCIYSRRVREKYCENSRGILIRFINYVSK